MAGFLSAPGNGGGFLSAYLDPRLLEMIGAPAAANPFDEMRREEGQAAFKRSFADPFSILNPGPRPEAQVRQPPAFGLGTAALGGLDPSGAPIGNVSELFAQPPAQQALQPGGVAPQLSPAVEIPPRPVAPPPAAATDVSASRQPPGEPLRITPNLPAEAPRPQGAVDSLRAALSPPSQSPGLLERLANTGGLVGGVANLLGAITGEGGAGPATQVYRLMVSKGMDPVQAKLLAGNRETAIAWLQAHAIKDQVRPMTAEEKARYGLPAGAPWVIGGDGKPTLPEGFTALQPKMEKVGPGEVLYSVPNAAAGGAPSPLINGGEKPPPNYQWIDPKDPAKGVTPIPGSSATQIPTEAVGRLAMIDSVLPNYKQARAEMERAWGAGDYAKWAANAQEVGRARRVVSLGVEAALRTMTGAAAPPHEIKQYLDYYMPGPADTKETAQQKLQLLEDFMTKARAGITQGRTPASQGGWQDVAPGIRIREVR